MILKGKFAILCGEPIGVVVGGLMVCIKGE